LNNRFFVLIAVLLLPGFYSLVKADQTIDFKAIQQQAVLANAAYQTENDVRDMRLTGDYELTFYHIITDIQIGFFLITDHVSKTQIVSVRGTSNIENAMVDVSIKLITDETTNLSLHNGFAYAAREVYNAVKPSLENDYLISTTGHSLGGAVAVILAMYLDADRYRVGQVTTFGQPKVTNLGGANTIAHLDITRVVTPRDLVPLIPLFDPLDINNLDIFWHAGKEIVLLDENKYAILTGVNSMLRATRFTQQMLDEENLRHHTMQLYLDLIAKRIDSAEQVDYENSFNLFNLFGSD